MDKTSIIIRFASAVLALTLLVPFSSPRPSQAAPTVAMVSGTVVAAGSNSVTVQPHDGATITFKVTPSTAVVIDGNTIKASDLKVGTIANFDTSDGVLTAIYGRTPETDTWGKITAVTSKSITVTDDSGVSSSFAIASSTAVIINTKPATPTDLKVGTLADVEYGADPTTATKIEVVPPNGGHFHGTISAVSSAALTIKSLKSAPISFTISPTATVTIDGNTAKVGDLKVGELAEVTALDGTTATVIAASTQPRPGGRRQGGPGTPDPNGM